MPLSAAPTNLLDPVRVIDIAPLNLLDNYNFRFWQRGISETSDAGIGDDVSTSLSFCADRWFVKTGISTCTQSRSTTVPDAKSLYSLKITGQSGLTSTVEFGQRLPASNAYRRKLTFSCKLYNATGVSQTPIAYVYTPDALNTWSTSVIRATGNMQACANGAWTEVSFPFDGTSLTNAANGLEVRVRITGGMNSSSKYIIVSQAQLSPTYIPGGFWPETDPEGDFLRCLRYFLVINDTNFGSQYPRWDDYGISTSILYKTFPFPVPMVRTPTFDPYLPATTTNCSGLPGFTANRFGLKIGYNVDQVGNVSLYRSGDWRFSAELL